jgi:hypothetical protein
MPSVGESANYADRVIHIPTVRKQHPGLTPSHTSLKRILGQQHFRLDQVQLQAGKADTESFLRHKMKD